METQNRFRSIVFSTILLSIAACSSNKDVTVTSPDSEVSVNFSLSHSGEPSYTVMFQGKNAVRSSTMGFKLLDGTLLTDGFRLDSVTKSSFHEVWVPVWGENDSIDNTYNSFIAHMSKRDFRMDVEFRVYDDGIGFRYVFPLQNVDTLLVAEELTQFAMPSNLTAWWMPGDYDTNEYNYVRARLSEIRDINLRNEHFKNVSSYLYSPSAVQTPLMLRSDEGLYMNIHEAALIDYPAMHLDLNDSTFVFTSHLTPGCCEEKALMALPRTTPWRVVMLGDKATDILATNIVYNLNEPCKIEDTSWIKPVKYMGVWWEMITGASSWSYGDIGNVDLNTIDYSKVQPHGHHGANNDNVRRYIDFAAANGFDQVVVEGWNIGWEDWFGKEKEFVFDFVTPYPDFDIKALNDYAHKKGIRLMMHHETASSINNYEQHLDTAYSLMNEYGYNVVKSGYVGNIVPKGDYHFSQRMVNHYINAVKKAADYKIMVNAHEAVRPTGLARTYPNLIANESCLGQEHTSVTPAHIATIPFTRLKGGPMDFTPGVFRMDITSFAPGYQGKKKIATIANQLALYVTMYSPLQMAADMPEHYAEKLDAFQFIKDVPVEWKRSIYLDGEPGDYIVAARLDKNSDNWFVGGVANDSKDYTLRLDFLSPEHEYEATVYADAPDADCYDNPEANTIFKQAVSCSDSLDIHMARGGGFAISIRKK